MGRDEVRKKVVESHCDFNPNMKVNTMKVINSRPGKGNRSVSSGVTARRVIHLNTSDGYFRSCKSTSKLEATRRPAY